MLPQILEHLPQLPVPDREEVAAGPLHHLSRLHEDRLVARRRPLHHPVELLRRAQAAQVQPGFDARQRRRRRRADQLLVADADDGDSVRHRNSGEVRRVQRRNGLPVIVAEQRTRRRKLRKPFGHPLQRLRRTEIARQRNALGAEPLAFDPRRKRIVPAVNIFAGREIPITAREVILGDGLPDTAVVRPDDRIGVPDELRIERQSDNLHSLGMKLFRIVPGVGQQPRAAPVPDVSGQAVHLRNLQLPAVAARKVHDPAQFLLQIKILRI